MTTFKGPGDVARSTYDNLDDFFTSGPPATKFANVGDVNGGYITRIDKAQARDFDTGKPATWEDGNPVMNLVFWLAESATGDATSRLYARKPSAMLTAIGEAVRAAGARVPEVGGKLTVKRLEDSEPPRKGLNAPKQFRAKYEPPAPRADVSEEDF